MSKERVAIITGASSGIGAATAIALAKDGFHVIAVARRADRLADLAKQSNLIESFVCDVTKQADVDLLAAHCNDKAVEILIHSAGGAFDAATILDGDPDIWEKTYEINVIATLRVTKAITPLMQSRGKGHIVIISSTAGHRAYENGGSYVAAKFAETSMAHTLRLELNGQPIRIT
jgi:NADP-dependent 3-hydroxy acid dehydrogenase YdfG